LTKVTYKLQLCNSVSVFLLWGLNELCMPRWGVYMIGQRKKLLPGGSVSSFVLLGMQKSAEAIVVSVYEPRTETVEASQANEGQNVT
jgi:hypothetical protein